MAPSTLARQLWLRTAAVVAVVAVLLSAGLLLTARAMLHQQVDQQLDAALTRQQRGPGEGDGNRPPGLDAPGMPLGTIVVIATADGTVYGSGIVEGGYSSVTVDAAHSLLAVGPDDGKSTVEVPGMGSYRVMAQDNGSARVAVALPLADAQRTLTWLSVLAAVITLVAIAGAALATRAVTTSTTAPLRRLSETAGEMSRLDLSRGDVALPAPVTSGDLTPNHEVGQLTEAFNLMLANVSDALSVRQSSETKLRRFVADASHELRNPLASIRGYAELAERADGADKEFALGRINAEATRLTSLVGDLLLLARLDAEATRQLRPVDVVEVALNAVSDARISGPDHIWQLRLPEEGFEVMADPGQLHQAVVNLLSNARTHTPAGTTVTTTVGIRDGWGCVVVADDGPGIPDDVLPRVFERFSRGDDSRRHTEKPSTGLGLAIVQAVVTSFGGRATVESSPDHTEFTLWLPRAD